jgi:arabinose-5-phosphate isomerase
MDFVERGREVMDIEIAGLRKVRDGLGDAFDETIRLLLEALGSGGKIVVAGIGKNLSIAGKISATLASTGATSVVLNPSQAMHGDLGILCRGDVLLALSYSGESQELLEIVPMARRIGVLIVSITGAPDGSLARLSDKVLPVTVDREACPFNMAPTASTVATLSVGDAIAMVLVEARGFRKEDYAMLHPGGAIGRSLLLRASDIMRGGDRLAVVNPDSTVRETVLAMTRARSGSAAVVEKSGTLVGFFTDGDLRRLMANDVSPMDMPIARCMTRNPIAVRGAQLAVEVLNVFENSAVDDIPVVDPDGKLMGAIDIQDLPKFKIL